MMLEKAISVSAPKTITESTPETLSESIPIKTSKECQTVIDTIHSEQQTNSIKTETKGTMVKQEVKDENIETDLYLCNICKDVSRATTPKEPTGPTDTNTNTNSLYLIVQNEKEKYKQLVARTFEEKKRKQQETLQLKQELQVIKSVLKMAGLKFDYKEYLEMSVKEPILIKNSDLKQSLLPPIGQGSGIADSTNTNSTNPSNTNTEPTEKTIHQMERDISDMVSELTFVPPKDNQAHYVRNRKMRPYSADQIPAILTHNQNLDYNNRAHIHLDNVVYQLEPIVEQKELPPVIEKKKTGYASRVWRAKVVKKLKEHL
jgi:hypothetical protein